MPRPWTLIRSIHARNLIITNQPAQMDELVEWAIDRRAIENVAFLINVEVYKARSEGRAYTIPLRLIRYPECIQMIAPTNLWNSPAAFGSWIYDNYVALGTGVMGGGGAQWSVNINHHQRNALTARREMYPPRPPGARPLAPNAPRPAGNLRPIDFEAAREEIVNMVQYDKQHGGG